jgi:hypothetical protein
MSPTDDLRISPMTPSDLAVMVEWLAQDGLNPGLQATTLYEAFEDGLMLMGRVNGERAAALMGTRYSGEFGMVGPGAVNPALRGRGYGHAMFAAMLERLGDGPLAADVPPELIAPARQYGFEPRYEGLRMRGAVGVRAPLPDDGTAIVPVAAVSREALMRYDHAVTGMVRTRFLQHWLEQGDSAGVALLDGEGALLGYAFVRACRVGYRIGPLFANDLACATRLFDTLCSRVGWGQTIFMDVPDRNPAAVQLAADRDLVTVATAPRMVRGDKPATQIERVFGVTNWLGP